MAPPIDYLGVAALCQNTELIVFIGRSGSGKSTALRQVAGAWPQDRPLTLVDEVRRIADLRVVRHELARIAHPPPAPSVGCAVAFDACSLRPTRGVLTQRHSPPVCTTPKATTPPWSRSKSGETGGLGRGGAVAVASHLAAGWFTWPRRLRGRRTTIVDLDARHDKLALWLDQQAIRYTDAGLSHFIARFGASFTELQIVLEAGVPKDLDLSLTRFGRYGSIATTRCERAPAVIRLPQTPSRPRPPAPAFWG